MLCVPGPDEPGFVGKHDCLYAVAEVELLQEVVDVSFDRRIADEQLSSDLRVGQPTRDQFEDV